MGPNRPTINQETNSELFSNIARPHEAPAAVHLPPEYVARDAMKGVMEDRARGSRPVVDPEHGLPEYKPESEDQSVAVD